MARRISNHALNAVHRLWWRQYEWSVLTMPLISICIPTYNHARFLAESLRSATAQTHHEIEIIVLDNDSQDDTEAVVARAAAIDPRIRYVRHPRNIGLVGNLNACIRSARGNYIKILCADDSLEPGCVAAMLDAFHVQPTASLVGCARIVTDANLSALRISRARTSLSVISGEEMLAECFFYGNRIGEPTAVMFRRADALRGFSERYQALVDLEMWFHLLCKGNFVALPQTLCRFRTHAGQATSTIEQSGGIIDERKLLYREFVEHAAKYSGLFRKSMWDFRMAYLVARSRSSTARSAADAIPETFFPRAYRLVTYPIVKAMMALGLKRVWRTA
jgi:Glycosyl transferase family 2